MESKEKESSKFETSSPPALDAEREACVAIDPKGFLLRPPPPPHKLSSFITPENQLFQTIHMGAAVINSERWVLVIDGLVRRPFALTLEQLKALPQVSVTAFHECYGSPIKPPIANPWRIGNVVWSGVRLSTILELADPIPGAKFVWSEGLDHGQFFQYEADRYQKDLTIAKALEPEVIVAWKINGEPLSKNRGGPVRLVVPGWFGTNSTKWLCKLSLQAHRAPGPYAAVLYNEKDPEDPYENKTRPVWEVEVNSMVTKPAESAVVKPGKLEISGWAWSHDGVKAVEVSTDDGCNWVKAIVEEREDQAWQKFVTTANLKLGVYKVLARAMSQNGAKQPLTGRRNHVHAITVTVNN
ncbi:sulfite oxidase [Fusarium heterosporum]|uniref:Sulfite oxidase n=1 Tax=Fusarium heterosporum TaxID=42747 RepID=A0A8H5U071_FUSHE|nr:sulfite oxidase [Fusarium heterosporum]